MKVAISSGHSSKCRGASGFIDEVDEARRVVACVAEYLRDLELGVAEFHDDISTSQNENLDRILDFHNAQDRRLDVSVHFNAYETTDSPRGTECLFVTQEELSTQMAKAIAEAGGFINRGAKYRGDLAFLNGTHEPAILIEVCFVDSRADVDLYHRHFNTICDAIAMTIAQDLMDFPLPDTRPRPSHLHPPMLKKGSTGPHVCDVQNSLAIPVDGDFGPLTDAAVRAFQSATDLDADGIVEEDTWDNIDQLDASMARGSDGISDALATSIDNLIDDYGQVIELYWPDRGVAPIGYYNGMAKVFALAMMRFMIDDPAAAIMGEMAGDPDTDALAWYAEDFAIVGMQNEIDGIDTLRHLFVFMVGLGMRESSGNPWVGRDQSASNTQADTAEAGLFQSSWNLHTCADEIELLFNEYSRDPNGFGPTFRRAVQPTKNDVECFGDGPGARYQWLAKFSPAFAVLMTAIGLRRRKDHWGPVKRKEVDIMPEIDAFLRIVQRLTERHMASMALRRRLE
jgi:peptidoglycan hydrolase-like protein with peptidoglycan-binding domain